jgi:hypothetical protein
MADIKDGLQDEVIPILRDLVRAVNAQARLLNHIVKAADMIVKGYVEVTKVEEPNGEKKEAV